MAAGGKPFAPKECCSVLSGDCFMLGMCLNDCMKAPQREHIASASCWCNPVVEYVDEDTGISVWLHKMIH